MMLRSNPLSVFMRKNAPDTRGPGQNCETTDEGEASILLAPSDEGAVAAGD